MLHYPQSFLVLVLNYTSFDLWKVYGNSFNSLRKKHDSPIIIDACILCIRKDWKGLKDFHD